MTYKELAAAILALPTEALDEQAVVWPPQACPETSAVPVTGLDNLPVKKFVPVIVTGKKP